MSPMPNAKPRSNSAPRPSQSPLGDSAVIELLTQILNELKALTAVTHLTINTSADVSDLELRKIATRITQLSRMFPAT